MWSQNNVKELNTRINEKKNKPKICYKLLHFLSFNPIPIVLYTISINIFTFQAKHIYRCNPISIITINVLLRLFDFMFTFLCFTLLDILDTMQIQYSMNIHNIIGSYCKLRNYIYLYNTDM